MVQSDKILQDKAVNQPNPKIPESALFKVSDPYNVSSMGENFSIMATDEIIR